MNVDSGVWSVRISFERMLHNIEKILLLKKSITVYDSWNGQYGKY